MAGEVSFQLTEEDCVAAYRDWLRGLYLGRLHGSGCQGLVTMFILIGILLAVAIASNVPWILAYDEQAFAVLPLVMGGFAILWIWRAYSYFRLPRLARRLFHQRRAFDSAITYDWSEEGLGFRTFHANGRIPWADLYRWRATENCFLFFIDEQSFLFIPRSALGDAQANDLEATVAASGAPVAAP